MKIATKPSAEVDSRVPEQPGLRSCGNERVSPETGGETRTALTIPPPVLIPRRVRESRVFRRGPSFSCWRWRREFGFCRPRPGLTPPPTGGKTSVSSPRPCRRILWTESQDSSRLQLGIRYSLGGHGVFMPVPGRRLQAEPVLPPDVRTSSAMGIRCQIPLLLIGTSRRPRL